MAVFEVLENQQAGVNCAFNGLLNEFLSTSPELDDTLSQAFSAIAQQDPETRIVKDLKSAVRMDVISNRIIHYRDISKLDGSPVVYPYLLYGTFNETDQAVLVLPYEEYGYLIARGLYYCMSETGSEFYDARNEILELCESEPEAIVKGWNDMKQLKAGSIQRRIDRDHFRNYEELKTQGIEAGASIRDTAAKTLGEVEDRAPYIREYVGRWFLLKKLLYVQYMVNKNIRASVHDGDIHKQRNQARINADEVPYLAYRQMWVIGTEAKNE